MAIEVSRAARVAGGPSHSRVIGPGGAAYWLSAALGVAAAASSLLTFTVPAVLRGTAVMNGSARGTALVVLLAGIPTLACLVLLAARGSAAAVITWLGAAGFLLYNSLMFVFATPGEPAVPAVPDDAGAGGLVRRRGAVAGGRVIAGIGVAEILLAWRWQRAGKIVTGSRDQRP